MSEFYNRPMKSWLQDNNKEIKESFCKIYQNLKEKKLYKCTTSISKNVYINKSNNIVNK